MLAVKSYPTEYVNQCREKVARDAAAFEALRKSAGDGSAIAAAETSFFNNLAIVLDRLFVHRLRAAEGKDGNPLNEVRAIADSIAENGGRLRVEKGTKLAPERSVTGLREGDEIRLDGATFARLSAAFFDEIERRFATSP
jgi:hypothetical protein